jgi:hypothetical protein
VIEEDTGYWLLDTEYVRREMVQKTIFSVKKT